MKSFIIILLILSSLTLTAPVFAASNNKFGIHVTHAGDLNRAIELVNSSGGDWGYVTIVIQDHDQKKDKWQQFFNTAREKHLIPIVRIATHLEGEFWQKPTQDSLNQWADFLDSLNWPIKTRYVVIFNEPNHAKEWGGEVNPKEYAQILNKAIDVFKNKNPNFFILNAGLDQAAPNSSTTMEEGDFLKEMNFEVPRIFSRLDGWDSHSYPNHGFVGLPWETGKATVKGYAWELEVLKSFGLDKNLPVFITETGWPHKIIQNAKFKVQNYYNTNITASYTKQAFENVWLLDERVMAITPFIVNYPAYPFENFSWIDRDGNPYPQFTEIQNLAKTKGEPEQEEKYELIDISLPNFLPTNFSFKGKITLLNNGQSIWGERPFNLESTISRGNLTQLTLPGGILVKPGEKWTFGYTLETSSRGGELEFSWKNLPTNKLSTFEVWKLTNEKTSSFFNKIFQTFLKLWYGL